MKIVDWIAKLLLVIGGLNWGLVGAFDLDLVGALLGHGSLAARVVYIVVGLAAIYAIAQCRKCCSEKKDSCCK